MTSIPATARSRALSAVALGGALLIACTSPAPVPGGSAGPSAAAAGLPRYRCEHGIAFTVQQGDDSVTIDAGPRGREVLLRDAGGVTPQHTVYSNGGVKAEFGLGAAGTEAILRYAQPPLVARCVRD